MNGLATETNQLHTGFMFILSIYAFTDCAPMKTPPNVSGKTFLKVSLNSLEENSII